jgi:hypothetical protein
VRLVRKYSHPKCKLFTFYSQAGQDIQYLPQDVDLVVLTTMYGQEALKQLLAGRTGSKFFLVPARTPGATYKVSAFFR